MLHQLLVLTRSSVVAVHRTLIVDNSSTDVPAFHWKVVTEEGIRHTVRVLGCSGSSSYPTGPPPARSPLSFPVALGVSAERVGEGRVPLTAPTHPDLLAEKLQTRSILTLHLVSFQGIRSYPSVVGWTSRIETSGPRGSRWSPLGKLPFLPIFRQA